ncbi:DNA methyltransferase, partial [Corynebacterium jeddahense]
GMLPPPGKHWQYTPERLDEMDAKGEIYWSPTGNPRRKIYLDSAPGVAMQNIWLEYKDAHNQNIKITGYPTEKNLDLLKTVIRASSDEGDLVLDAFAGSGTTLEASASLGRRWIGIDNSSLAIKTIEDRFELGSAKMGDFRPKTAAAQTALDLGERRAKDFWIKELSD